MGNPRPVGKDTTVAIAVKKGSCSQAALKWTIDNLMTEGHSVTLLFSGPDVRNGIDEGFKDILLMRAQEMLQPFQSYCQKKKIQSDVVILEEDDDPVVTIADFVLVYQIDVLGRLLSVRSSEHHSSYHEPPIGSQLSDSTSSGFVAVPHLEKESEFRSPLQNYRHSHITSEESKLDISFVNSDRAGGSSSSYSDNSSFIRSYNSSNSSN
ncbi:hypothetical protein QQ045_022713 [Rhodiola kirilowii]